MQQDLQMPTKGLTFQERGPRTKLYAIISDMHSLTRSQFSIDLGYGVTFTSDKEAAMKLREVFPLPLRLVKKLFQPKRIGFWGARGKPTTPIKRRSWRDDRSGFDGDESYVINNFTSLLKIMRGEI